MSFNKTFQIVVCTVFMLSCKSDGIASEGPGIHLRPPTSYYGLMNPSATAVVGSIRAIEGQPRTTLSSETSNVGGQSVRAAYDYYRGEIVDPQVVMAKQNCLETAIARNDLDYRWISQNAPQYPRYVDGAGAPIPSAQLPQWAVRERRAEQTLVPGERAVFFAACPTKTYCPATGCPNHLVWKLPLLEGDVVDLSGFTSTKGERGPSRIPLREALDLIAADWNPEAPFPDRKVTVFPLPALGSGTVH